MKCIMLVLSVVLAAARSCGSDANGRGRQLDCAPYSGSVTVYFARGNSRGGSLSTSGGRVTAYVDPEAALDIDASSSGGDVTVDLPVNISGTGLEERRPRDPERRWGGAATAHERRRRFGAQPVKAAST